MDVDTRFGRTLKQSSDPVDKRGVKALVKQGEESPMDAFSGFHDLEVWWRG